MWNKGWDVVYSENEWGKYPPEELIRFIASNFKNVKNKKKINILEVGSGTGANLCFLSKEGFTVTGVDGSKVGMNIAKKRLEYESLHAKLILGDIISMPFGDNTFNCAIDNECIYSNNMSDSEKILKEIWRVLKPGGLLYSKAFMVGSFGYGKGTRYNNESHTFVNLKEGTAKADYGIIRFTSEDDIANLYGNYFTIKNYEYVKRSIKNRTAEVSEWIISCIKE